MDKVERVLSLEILFEIPYKEWLKEFINNNTFESIFEENHYVEGRIARGYKNADNESFFIMNKNFNAE